MANWQDETRDAALRYGLDPNIFYRQIKQESHFDPNIVSPAGAIGIAQIMPGTARGWGVDPHDPRASLDAAAKNMAEYVKKYGSYKNALVAYNAGPGRVGGPLPAETQNYISTILINGRDPGHLGAPSSGGGGGHSGGPVVPHGASGDPSQALTQPVDMGSSSGAATALLQAALSGARRQPVAASALQPPAVTAGPVLPDAYRALTATQGPAPRADVGALISAAMTQGGGTGVVAPQSDASAPVTASDASAGGQSTPSTSGAGNVRISPHARPGDPVVSSKQSIGGQHDTMNLPGYPAHDYFAPAGTNAVAPVGGKIIKVSGSDPRNGPSNGPHGPLGYSLYIQGTDGKTYFLTHMGTRNVKVGQTVRPGQIIGTVANYDKYGTPSHIHMGVHG